MRKEAREIKSLNERIEAGKPSSGTNPLAVEPDETGYLGAKRFEQLPISDRTKKALREAKYVDMTKIQRAAIPHALCGRDVLGAAKTGSGKTLAFVIPVIEHLYRLGWASVDGVGALIVTPTRELGFQIYMQLQKVGKYHSLSAGLIVGGRGKAGKEAQEAFEEEKARINRLNIIVCTPGRLLQHLDQTANFDCSQLQVLVLDEADRILDEGFAATLNHILEQIPKERQTLLFSATQKRSVQDLARLGLKDPEYLSVHEESTSATPTNLKERAIVVPLDQKLNTLWSFIKTHLRCKMLVFLTSCKQVKFVHEAFRRLQPGVPLTCLHGRQSQRKRLEVFLRYVETRYAVLFATDIAARGLDFPAVDWVVQMDCPENVATYIHRAGRTARYAATGRSLLFLMPSEKDKMLELLSQAKPPIPITCCKRNSSKIRDISTKMAALLSENPELKTLAQRAFVTYLRSVHLQGNKEIFDVQKLPIAEYAASYGLPTAPRVRFIRKGLSNVEKNLAYELRNTKGHEKKRSDVDGSDDEGASFFQKKRPREDVQVKAAQVNAQPKKKLKIQPGKTFGQRLVFDEDGNAVPPLEALAKEASENKEEKDDDVAAVAALRYKQIEEEMKKRDMEDKRLERERLRNKRMKMKKKVVMEEAEEAEEEAEEGEEEEAEGEEEGEEEEESEEEEEESEEEEDEALESLAEQEARAAKLLENMRRF